MLCSFEGPRRAWSLPVSGGYGEGETPLPIPNRAVKPLSADGTWLARAWESRSPPVLNSDPVCECRRRGLVVNWRFGLGGSAPAVAKGWLVEMLISRTSA